MGSTLSSARKLVASIVAIAVVLIGAQFPTAAWAAHVVAGDVTVAGSAAVGSTLTATEGTWDPVDTAFTYEWRRDGVAISGQSFRTYVTVTDDIGAAITVVVSGEASGHQPVSATSSNSVTPIGSFATTGTPTLTGTPSVGETLGVDTTNFSPTPTSLSYQWKRDGTDIPDATTSTFALTEDDAGHSISVSVTAEKSSYNSSTVTSNSLSVTGTFTSIPLPTISGTETVGETLTATPGDIQPTPTTFGYQWKRGGVAISGATASTYDLVAADLGELISVTTTAIRSGFTSDSSTSLATGAIAAATFTATGTPTVSGTTDIGDVLTAATGTWTPAPDSFSYQWTRDGSDIDGATESTYTLTATDMGTDIAVVVTGVRAGYTTDSGTSLATTVPLMTFTAVATPLITGSVIVDQMLTATTDGWTPSPDSFAYRWFRDGIAISGATSSTYSLVAADLGAVITVETVASKAGYADSTTLSDDTALVAEATFAFPGSPGISGDRSIGDVVTAHEGFWTPDATSYTFQWVRDSVDIDGETSSTYTLTVDDMGTVLTVRVWPHLDGYASDPVESADFVVDLMTFSLSPVPTISGTASTGGTLTAGTAGWSPTPDSFDYQWQCDGTDIVGATSASLDLTDAEVGCAVSVGVTAIRAGYAPTTEISAETDPVTASPFDTVGTATVSGSLGIGDLLTADPGSWTPTPDGFTYQWSRNGIEITGATEDTYTLTDLDMGTDITVDVTATLAGYNTTTVTSAATEVPLAEFSTTGLPEIVGTLDLGDTVTVSADVFSPTPDSLSYQWYRNGDAIDGATEDSYTIVVADSAADITVDVTGSLQGYADLTLTSLAATASEVLRFTVSPRPSVSGVAQVGRTLTAAVSAWTPTPDSFDYQWLRNGVAIDGAISETYELAGADAGTAISVRISPVLMNYVPITRTSQPTTLVINGVFSVRPVPTISGTPEVGELLTADTDGWSPTPSSFSHVWFRDGVAISGATASTYRLVAADLGSAISVRVTPVLTGYTSSARTSLATSGVVAGSFTTTTPTINGTAEVGETLTVQVAAWSPSATFTYQWKRDGVNISGATGSTYVVTLADAGSAISVTVTGTATGVETTSTTSAPTDDVPALSFSGGSTATVVGDAAVGNTLSVNFGTLSPTPTAVTYQWKSDGVNIVGATGATFTPTIDELWSEITVAVTATKIGYTPWTSTSTNQAVVSEGVIGLLSAPTILGTARVGRTLTGTTGTWTHTPDSFDVQWYRDGEPIDDATTTTYVLTSDDLGSTIAFGVVARRDGFVDEEALSLSTSEVRLASFNAQPTPTITGTVRVGSTLTAVPGAWSPTPTSFTYQWTRGGVPISGATGSTLVLSGADAGSVIRVVVTGVRDNYEGDAKTSAATVSVATGTFSATPIPTIAGDAKVGEILTATTPAWTPVADSTVYQWRRGGVAIDGATARTYTVTAADLGARLTVSATGSKTGYASVTSTSVNTVSVAAATFTTLPSPVITGTPTVGETLTATAGTWIPTPDTLSFQWRRDDLVISGATSSTYTLQPIDAGAAITVTVSAAKTAFTTASRTSAATDDIAALPFEDTVLPTIDGIEAVGNTLRVSTGDWTPTPTRFEYEWLRDGEPIDGATSSTYTLVGADAESVISVNVTGIKLGYISTTHLTDETGVIDFGTFSATPSPTISGTVRVGATLTANPGTWLPAPVTLEYQWMSDGADIDGATESTFVPTEAEFGTAISVRVEASKLGYISENATSEDTALVAEGVLTATPTPTVSGVAQVGQTLTANAGAWRPATVDLEYQWRRGTTDISGATSSTYVLTADDRGFAISVTVTGSREAYSSVTKTSKATTSVIRGVFTSSPQPTFNGSFTVGKTITAVTGAWSSSPTFTYTWFRGKRVIVGATSSTYTLTTSDLNKKIRVTVVASRPGFTSVTRTSITRTVGPGVFDASPTPTITGTTAVGSTLTAVPGVWTPAATLSYQWNRNGAPITGATASTYAVTGIDAGATLSVTVTGTKASYTTVSRTSANTATISTINFTSTPTPTVAGTLRVGETLTASAGSWSPTPTTTTYQWYRDGSPILGATRSTYTAVAADRDKNLSVAVTASLLGYNTTTRTSLSTDPIAIGIFSPAPNPTISGTERVGLVLTVSPGTWGPVTPSFEYQWKRDGDDIAGADRSTYELTASDIGAVITVDVTANAGGFTSVTKTSAATGVIGVGIFSPAPTPTITGTMGVGSTATVSTGTWGPGTVPFTYQWTRDGVDIDGATSASYSIVDSDIGKSIAVSVTATRTGFTSVTKVSAARTVVSGTFQNLTLPTITGGRLVGLLLRATAGTWTPSPTTTEYQWLRNGTPISGATRLTYTTVVADIGKDISVRVTVTRANYNTTSAVSANLRIG